MEFNFAANTPIPNKMELASLRETYPKGCRIQLIRMDDSQAVPTGTVGTVDYIDGMGQIHVRWANGSSLAIVPGMDCFLKCTEESI